MKNENLVLGATMSFRQKSKSRELMPMKYPESSPKTHNINELKKAYETQSYDFICQEVGTMTKRATNMRMNAIRMVSLLICTISRLNESKKIERVLLSILLREYFHSHFAEPELY